MARKQLAMIAALGIDSLLQITLEPVKTGKNDIAFVVSVGGSVGAVPTGLMEVADEAGKVRRFKDVDDFVKQAGALGMLSGSFSMGVDAVDLLQPKPFTGDIVKKNQNLVVGYNKRKTDAAARSAVLATELALMAGDSSIPQAVIDEKTAQKNSVDQLVVWLNAEIVRINAILAG